jgi:SNF2 family DNA or RNA helicase
MLSMQELFNIYEVVQPGLLGDSRAEFKTYYNAPIKASLKDSAKPDVRAIGKRRSAELQAVIKPHYLQMSKEDAGALHCFDICIHIHSDTST